MKFIDFIIKGAIFTLEQIFNGIIIASNLTLKGLKRYKSTKPKTLPILSIEHEKNGRYLRFLIGNDNLLNIYDGLKAMFNTLKSNNNFINFGKTKVIIVSAIINGNEVSYHHNVLINENTTFEDYYSKISEFIQKHSDKFYGVEVIPCYVVKVWDMTHLKNQNITLRSTVLTKHALSAHLKKDNGILNLKRGFSTTTNSLEGRKSSLDYITSLSKYKAKILSKGAVPNKHSFGTMDIETITFNSVQTPICITACHGGISKLFIVDIDLFKNDSSKAVDTLWSEYFEFVKQFAIVGGYTIFVHNLGSFDGYFLHKALSKFALPDEVSSLLDTQNRFIMNKLTIFGKKRNKTICWKDSYRIFPVNLSELCKVFNVSGKISKYNISFNSIDMFNNIDLLNLFKEYSLQDSISLYNALVVAQSIYLDSYFVDITRILSTASLSLKIFRLNFLGEGKDIPILRGMKDKFVRESYLGGATDYYKKHVSNLKVYDVNSLYPQAMMNDMPYELIKEYSDMSGISLNNFFGFVKARIKVSRDIKIPLLPYKHNGKTIFPTGEFEGVYFSEELKAVQKHGYQIELLKGYEFSRINYFNEYVRHFYDKKANSTGAERFIAKMHLNQLYGVFGKKQEVLSTLNVATSKLEYYVSTHIIKTIINMGEISTILVVKNVAKDIIQGLNSTFELDVQSGFQSVKSNVAIASAVTSYGRIQMIGYKVLLGDSLAYTDTDSLYTTKPLPSKYIGSGLGLLKDELNGLVIKEACFLGIKKYGYIYNDLEGNVVNKSVVAGYQRNGLSFEEIKMIGEGTHLIKTLDVTRFEKSITSLDISTTLNPKITISNSLDKALHNNQYTPEHLSIGNGKGNFNLIGIINHYYRIYCRIKHFFVLNK